MSHRSLWEMFTQDGDTYVILAQRFYHIALTSRLSYNNLPACEVFIVVWRLHRSDNVFALVTFPTVKPEEVTFMVQLRNVSSTDRIRTQFLKLITSEHESSSIEGINA
jgi:hypothetical protein